jgi:P pilus assembly chaperone PapD
MMEVHVYSWNRDGGTDTLEPTDDLVGLPLTFALAPSSTQTVRIGIRGPVGGDKELAYRVVVGEIVPDRRLAQGIDMLVSFNFPVYIAPTGKIDRAAAWTAKEDDSRRLTLSVQNTGNVHLAFQHLLVRDGKHRDALVDTNVKDTVLAGGRYTWTFAVPAGVDLASLVIDAATDSGIVTGSLR